MKQSKPVFQSVVDLGLRDVGISNSPRRLAGHFGGSAARVGAVLVLSVFVLCLIGGLTGARGWIVAGAALAIAGGVLLMALRSAARAPVVVVKLTADGENRAVWLLLLAPFISVALLAVLGGGILLIPSAALALIMALLMWRVRGHVPEVLRNVRPLLAADERVLGDGIGTVRGERGRYNAFRLIIATDRRLLVVASTRAKERQFTVVDVPYERVSRFGIEWAYMGRAGVLALTLAGVDGAPPETHAITYITPANLVSVARALRSHGVEAEDPEAVSEAEHAWDEVRRQATAPKPPLFDRGAMSTRQFDFGLWLLLGLAAVGFWANPLGAWVDPSLLVLLVALVVCALSGYVSGTRSSLAYIVPLNLLVAPTLFLADVAGAISLMIAISVVAALGLWAGTALRGRRPGRASGLGRLADGPVRPAPRGSLRGAVSGRSLIRLSGLVLAALIGFASIASAAGFDPASIRMVVDEAFATQQPVDGRSNMTGNAASLEYARGPGLKEFIVDEHWDAGPNDGARWELRSSFTGGYNVVSLSHYIFEPHLDDPKAVAKFVADKDRQHTDIAGHRVTHTERVVDGRRGYVWTHGNSRGYWHYAVWFPQPIHTVRLECIAKKQVRRFKRLCSESLRSLEFN